jgi:hypothetical protein
MKKKKFKFAENSEEYLDFLEDIKIEISNKFNV